MSKRDRMPTINSRITQSKTKLANCLAVASATYMCLNCCCACDTRTNTTASIPHLQALEETVATTSQPAQATRCKGLREEQAERGYFAALERIERRPKYKKKSGEPDEFDEEQADVVAVATPQEARPLVTAHASKDGALQEVCNEHEAALQALSAIILDEYPRALRDTDLFIDVTMSSMRRSVSNNRKNRSFTENHTRLKRIPCVTGSPRCNARETTSFMEVHGWKLSIQERR